MAGSDRPIRCGHREPVQRGGHLFPARGGVRVDLHVRLEAPPGLGPLLELRAGRGVGDPRGVVGGGGQLVDEPAGLRISAAAARPPPSCRSWSSPGSSWCWSCRRSCCSTSCPSGGSSPRTSPAPVCWPRVPGFARTHQPVPLAASVDELPPRFGGVSHQPIPGDNPLMTSRPAGVAEAPRGVSGGPRASRLGGPRPGTCASSASYSPVRPSRSSRVASACPA